MSSAKDTRKKSTNKSVCSSPAVAPLAIGEANCEAAIGRPWRWVRELAARHNLPRLPGKMPVYRADALLALFAPGEDAQACPPGEPEENISVDSVLRTVGRRLGGAR